MRQITTSEVKTYLRCREEHRIAYAIGLRSSEPPSKALALGSAVHAGLEAWWGPGELVLPGALDAVERVGLSLGLDPYEVIRGQVMLEKYDLEWHRVRDDYVVRGLEAAFAHPAGKYALAGRYDGLVMTGRPARTLVLEHKTTSYDIDEGAEYWWSLAMDWQIPNYLRASGAAGVLYDVLRKPGIQPCRATPVEKRKYKADGTLYANQRAEDESLDAWRDRLRDCYREGVWFARREITLLEGELKRTAVQMDQIAEEILSVDPTRPQPQSPHACERFGKKCDYWAHCTKQAQLGDMPLRHTLALHEELL